MPCLAGCLLLTVLRRAVNPVPQHLVEPETALLPLYFTIVLLSSQQQQEQHCTVCIYADSTGWLAVEMIMQTTLLFPSMSP
jgi:hypothetical protein